MWASRSSGVSTGDGPRRPHTHNPPQGTHTHPPPGETPQTPVLTVATASPGGPSVLPRVQDLPFREDRATTVDGPPRRAGTSTSPPEGRWEPTDGAGGKPEALRGGGWPVCQGTVGLFPRPGKSCVSRTHRPRRKDRSQTTSPCGARSQAPTWLGGPSPSLGPDLVRRPRPRRGLLGSRSLRGPRPQGPAGGGLEVGGRRGEPALPSAGEGPVGPWRVPGAPLRRGVAVRGRGPLRGGPRDPPLTPKRPWALPPTPTPLWTRAGRLWWAGRGRDGAGRAFCRSEL